MWSVPIAAAAIAALASVGAAIVAGRYAKTAKSAEIREQRIRDLENRISDRKYNTYKPIIELFGNMLNPVTSKQTLDDSDALIGKISEFSSWISIFGSDQAVETYHRFMQAAYHDAPTAVTLRLYADFILNARRDMGYSDTRVSRAELIGTRIRDIYDPSKGVAHTFSKPFSEVCRENSWTPPWPAQRAEDSSS